MSRYITHTAVNAEEEEAGKGIILWNESSENEIVVLFYEIFVVNYAIKYVMSSHTHSHTKQYQFPIF